MRTIKREIIEMATELAEDYEAGIRDSYSGRGMYGESCFGVVLEDSSIAMFMSSLTISLYTRYDGYGDGDWQEIALELARAAKTDSMGMGTIVYFPRWNLED